ncbi:MAG: phage holin family protein [Negativicutes bacterium]|jgi:putative membrane protein
MKKTIASYAGIFAGLVIADKWLNYVSFLGYESLLIFALVLLLINTLVRPVVKLICLPINIATLGLFTLIINTVMIYIANYFYDSLKLTDFIHTLVAAIIIMVCQMVLRRLFVA